MSVVHGSSIVVEEVEVGNTNVLSSVQSVDVMGNDDDDFG